MSRHRLAAFAAMTCSLAAQGFALAQQTQGEIPTEPVPPVTGAIISEPVPTEPSPAVRKTEVKSQGHLIIRTPDGQVRQIHLPASNGVSPLSIIAATDRHGAIGEMKVEALPKFVIGVSLSDVPAVLRAHLTLPEGVGVLVGAVVADSPAAKAGLQQHDILLKSGDHDLKVAKDLQQLVDSSEGKPVSVTLQRKGEQKTIELTPIKREDLKFTQTSDIDVTVPGPGAFFLKQGEDPTQVLNMLHSSGVVGGHPMVFTSPGIVPPPNIHQMEALTNSIRMLTEQIERLQKSVDRLEGRKSDEAAPAPEQKAKDNGGAINAPRHNLTSFISVS